jgi:hypothetical protein
MLCVPLHGTTMFSEYGNKGNVIKHTLGLSLSNVDTFMAIDTVIINCY